MSEKQFDAEKLRILLDTLASTPPSEEEIERYEEEVEDYLLEEQQLKIEQLSDNIKARRTFAGRVFWVMVSWLFIVILFLYFVGIKKVPVPHLIPIPNANLFYISFIYQGIILSDAVLITLITTTTANVLFLFRIILKDLFPSK